MVGCILCRSLKKKLKNITRISSKRNEAFGELGHPDGPTVNLERVSHMITSLKWEGKNFIGEAKIMSTPMGEIVKNLMDEGVNSVFPRVVWVVLNRKMVQTM